MVNFNKISLPVSLSNKKYNKAYSSEVQEMNSNSKALLQLFWRKKVEEKSLYDDE